MRHIQPRSMHMGHGGLWIRYLIKLAVVWAAACGMPSTSAAGILTSHGLVVGQTLSGGVLNLPGSYVRTEGTQLNTGLLSDSHNNGSGTSSIGTGTALARTSLVAPSFLGAGSSSSSSSSPSAFPGFGHGIAAWRDIAFVNGPSLPSVIRLNFSVSGSVAVVVSGNGSSPANLAEIGIATSTAPTDFFQGINARDFSWPLEARAYAGQPGGPPSGTSGQWDSTFEAPITNGFNFIGTFHVDVAYSAALGGYGWGLR
jgi:hypothetical protein